MAKIIVVDDSGSVRSYIANFLASQNIEVVTAVDGVDALNQLTKDDDIDLAFVDVNMPNMDGLSLVRKARALMPENRVTFVMLTTEFSSEMKAQAKQLGVRGWIVKPFRIEKTIGPVLRLLAEQQGAL